MIDDIWNVLLPDLVQIFATSSQVRDMTERRGATKDWDEKLGWESQQKWVNLYWTHGFHDMTEFEEYEKYDQGQNKMSKLKFFGVRDRLSKVLNKKCSLMN